MKIFITPKDIINRCIWDNFEYYVLSKQKVDVQAYIKENKEFEIKEEDALVIGLLKILETNNLIHKFNEYITNYLVMKSSKFEIAEEEISGHFIKKKMLMQYIEDWNKKFPSAYEPDIIYAKRLEDVKKYIADLTVKINNLKVFTITEKLGTFDQLESKEIKKMLLQHAY